MTIVAIGRPAAKTIRGCRGIWPPSAKAVWRPIRARPTRTSKSRGLQSSGFRWEP